MIGSLVSFHLLEQTGQCRPIYKPNVPIFIFNARSKVTLCGYVMDNLILSIVDIYSKLRFETSPAPLYWWGCFSCRFGGFIIFFFNCLGGLVPRSSINLVSRLNSCCSLMSWTSWSRRLSIWIGLKVYLFGRATILSVVLFRGSCRGSLVCCVTLLMIFAWARSICSDFSSSNVLSWTLLI